MPRKREGFRGTSIKTELFQDIENFVQENPEYGYKSVADFVQEATRLRIQELRFKQSQRQKL